MPPGRLQTLGKHKRLCSCQRQAPPAHTLLPPPCFHGHTPTRTPQRGNSNCQYTGVTTPRCLVSAIRCFPPLNSIVTHLERHQLCHHLAPEPQPLVGLSDHLQGSAPGRERRRTAPVGPGGSLGHPMVRAGASLPTVRVPCRSACLCSPQNKPSLPTPVARVAPAGWRVDTAWPDSRIRGLQGLPRARPAVTCQRSVSGLSWR